MSSTNTQHEPTMEEILASIRKIISEDQPEPPKPAAAPPLRAVAPAPPPLAQAEEPDVLELTEEVHDEVVPAPPPPKAPAPVVAPRPPENDVVFESRDERKAEPPMTDHDLISDSTRDALGRSLANFDGAEAPRAATGGAIEAIFTRAVQEAFVSTLQEWVDAHHTEILNQMKPMIRAWMDENLPPLIQAAVAAELGRLNGVRRK
jgi:cell pole-organizing protein PopZ